ncbi:6418_t:CDS:2 [Cetraspora pellucida]|uniref:6418_t:CDS:1 n=1 Tax=Cetraspora pellucida TaxID=1433469 RepID=A0A9N8WA40_9GLOM|nr:6418_t:CDS:2 [Cetraspora pellucida]
MKILMLSSIITFSLLLLQSHYHSQGNFHLPDGFTREIYTINGRFPSPLIEVNKGDILIFNVNNYLEDETTIHSHGMFRHETPCYDGAPGKIRRDIPPEKSFTRKVMQYALMNLILVLEPTPSELLTNCGLPQKKLEEVKPSSMSMNYVVIDEKVNPGLYRQRGKPYRLRSHLALHYRDVPTILA